MEELKVFRQCLRQQLHTHQSMTAQDVVKLCYQAACGAEHLLTDMSGAERYFFEEYAAVPARDEPLYEAISADVCRVNLGAWKKTGMDEGLLFRVFSGTVFQNSGKARLRAYLQTAEEVLREEGFDMPSWDGYLQSYYEKGMPAVRHSEIYRQQENPAYRIVSTSLLQQLLSE